MKPKQKTKDLPSYFRCYLYQDYSYFKDRKRRFLYKLVQVWRYTKDKELAQQYINEMEILRFLSWSKYKTYKRLSIQDIEIIEDKYKEIFEKRDKGK